MRYGTVLSVTGVTRGSWHYICPLCTTTKRKKRKLSRKCETDLSTWYLCWHQPLIAEEHVAHFVQYQAVAWLLWHDTCIDQASVRGCIITDEPQHKDLGVVWPASVGAGPVESVFLSCYFCNLCCVKLLMSRHSQVLSLPEPFYSTYHPVVEKNSIKESVIKRGIDLN